MVGLPEPLSTLLDRVCQAVTTASGKAQIPCANQLLGPTNVVLRSCAPPESAFPSVRNSEVPQYVVGVETTVARLQKAFFNDPSGRGVLLRGGVGSGKSTIARAYVASHNGPDSGYPGGVVWLTGNTVAAVAQCVCDQMFRMKNFSTEATPDEIGRWFCGWLVSLQPKRWLLVVDGVGNGGEIERDRGSAASSVLKWLGRFLPRNGGHVLVTTSAIGIPRQVNWIQGVDVAVVSPLTRDQAVLALWRYIRRRLPAAPRDGDKGYLSLPHPDGMAAGLTSDPLRDDLVPSGVLEPHFQVEWGKIPECVATVWEWDCGEQRRDEGISMCIQSLAPGLPNLASMAQSQGITLLQWYTWLLMVRPEVTVDQHVQQLQDLQRSPKQRSLGRKLYAWACLEASDAAGNPIHAWASARIELFKAVQQTVRRLCGVSSDDGLHVRSSRQHASQQRRNSGDPCADKPLTELLPLFRHDPVEYVALFTLAGTVLTSPGSDGRPSVLLQAADAVVASGSCIASFLPFYERDQHLVASGAGVGTGVGASAGAGASAGGEIPERVAALWQHGHDGNRQQEIVDDLVPGSSSDPVLLVATQESH